MKIKILVLFLAITLSNTSIASDQTGQVTNIIVREDGLHWIYVSGTRSPKPACAGSNEYWMIKDENSLVGKAHFSMILSAYMSGKTVAIYGIGECTRWGDGEDIHSIEISEGPLQG